MITATTPGGNLARFHVREGTNDTMTVEGDVTQDRYHLASLPRKGGLYIDVGAHIGTWLVAALLDDPDAHAIAVEPLEANCGQIIANATLNGLQDRVAVVQGAFAKRYQAVKWGFSSELDPEQAAMHAYIGGFDTDLLPDDVTWVIERAKAVTPASLLKERVSVLKVAGETSERALVGAKLDKVSIIIGKMHSPQPELIAHLEKTHTVEVEKTWDVKHGWYRAVRS